MNLLTRLFPFLRWLPLRSETVRADLIAGITVALVLIPQSMAYAQLAGLPAYYGLYAAFLPVMVAALWGSSHQLATGPVAVVSLLTASALAPLAATGSEAFIALAIMLAFLVGAIQLTLGVFRLGVVVNFLSHPVIVGFTNAAAIIIGLSQLNKIFGVPMGRSEHFMKDIWGVLQSVGDTHVPTLIMGLSAFALMWILRKQFPKLPGVLIAVAITTAVSFAIDFEQKHTIQADRLADATARQLVAELEQAEARMKALQARVAEKNTELQQVEKLANSDLRQAALAYELDLLRIELRGAEADLNAKKKVLRKMRFVLVRGDDRQPDTLYLARAVPAGVKVNDTHWRIQGIQDGSLKLVAGGEVVGNIPSGLPGFEIPQFSWDNVRALLSSALVISLVGFMEAISIAKAMAAKTKQRIDPNQELIGQGIANIVGSMSQAYPTSGSFSRSAVNLNAGAVTGLSSVFTALIVLLTLLFLTPLLYHLPQAVLAAVIMMAVVGLINFKAIKHAWQAHPHDGIAAVVTFVATLAFAPHLDNGILVGAGLALILFLYRTMRPRVAVLGRFPDGTLRDLKVHPGLGTSKHVVAMRFDGQLYFANVSYFEDAILEAHASHPEAKYILVVADGINQLDASGEEAIHHLIDRLKENGVTLVFSGLKRQVLDVMSKTGLREVVGEDNIFATEDMALDAIYRRVCESDPAAEFCLQRGPDAAD